MRTHSKPTTLDECRVCGSPESDWLMAGPFTVCRFCHKQIRELVATGCQRHQGPFLTAINNVDNLRALQVAHVVADGNWRKKAICFRMAILREAREIRRQRTLGVSLAQARNTGRQTRMAGTRRPAVGA